MRDTRPAQPAVMVAVSTGSRAMVNACTRTADEWPATSGNGATRTWEGLMGTSPDTNCAEMQEEARSTPGSGCTSKVRSMGEPSTTTLRLLPSESAAALSATAYKPAPMMTSLFFTAVAFIER